MSSLRLGLIGFGGMGSAHAAAIAGGQVDRLTLQAICDIDENRLKIAGETYPGVTLYRKDAELLSDPSIDCVLVATPHLYHARLVEAALEHGKHVLSEKPMDVRLSCAQRAARKARASSLVYGIMFNQRTEPIFQRARAIVQSGELGALKRTVWIITNWYRTQHYYDSGAWRATWGGEGGGVLLNQAPHNLDLWQWICGMPASVRGFCDVARYHRIEVEDDATLLTTYPGGATGMFITSTGEFPGTNRLEISGTRGKLVLENGLLKFWQLEKAEDEVRFTSPVSFDKIPYRYSEETFSSPASGHVEILKNFTAAILDKAPLLAPGTDGLYELSLSNAAYLSTWTGNAEIPLPMDTEAFDRILDEKAASSRYVPKALDLPTSQGYSERWQVNW